MTWDDMKVWDTGEFQVVEENLEDLKGNFNPLKENLFNALDATSLDKVKVVIVGQDPYPEPTLATGIAFSIPKGVKKFPPTLMNIMKEYSTDLHLPIPESGCLDKWTKEGVLLWNAIPSCESWKPLSHYTWEGWHNLTKEILEEVSKKPGVVCVFLGGVTREFVKYVDQDNVEVLETSHPSPRGQMNSKNPFIGSRIFSTINDKLVSSGESPIDWRLE